MTDTEGMERTDPIWTEVAKQCDAVGLCDVSADFRLARKMSPLASNYPDISMMIMTLAEQAWGFVESVYEQIKKIVSRFAKLDKKMLMSSIRDSTDVRLDIKRYGRGRMEAEVSLHLSWPAIIDRYDERKADLDAYIEATEGHCL